MLLLNSKLYKYVQCLIVQTIRLNIKQKMIRGYKMGLNGYLANILNII